MEKTSQTKDATFVSAGPVVAGVAEEAGVGLQQGVGVAIKEAEGGEVAVGEVDMHIDMASELSSPARNLIF